MSVSVTTSTSVATSTTLATTSDDTQTLDSYATEQSLLATSVSDDPTSDDSLVFMLGGEATAVGEDTLADGRMEAAVDGTGPVTTAEGSAAFSSVASAPSDGAALATAHSYASLSGIDSLVVITSNSQIVHQDEDVSLWLASSATTVYGIDFGTRDSVAADESTSADPDFDLTPEGELAATDDEVSLYDSPTSLDGNIAVLEVEAEVAGSDTLLQAEVSVLTVEDTLSTVSGELVAAVG